MDFRIESLLIIITFLAFVATCTLYIKEKITNQTLLRLIKKMGQERDQELLSKAKFFDLGLMSAGIAHEISNPLSIIQSKTAHLLRIHKDPKSQKELTKGLMQIEYTSERIARTIRGIREYIYQDDQAVDDHIPLKELLDNVLVFCGQRLRNHNVELRIKNVDDIFVQGHRIQLEQAILNLINNSFDAIESLSEKWIQISAVEEKDSVEIFFKDSGHGIPDEIRDKMMEPFFTTKNNKGTGLGLALVKGIALKHGGNLFYVDQAKNTTFRIELPKLAHCSLN